MSKMRNADDTGGPGLSNPEGVAPTAATSPRRDRPALVDWIAWPLRRLFARGANTIHSQFHRLDIDPDAEDGPEA